ncbi:MAG: hypothetical protein LAO77_09075 [Acidobacteriia bacterium]|nr:hypothetical protein [Terriglobia bacterium]
MTSTRRETLRELKRDLEKVNREASRIMHAIRALQALDGQADTSVTASPKPKAKGALVGLNYPEAAHLVLSKTPPLSVNDLLDQMAKGGCPVSTSKPYRTIYKVLRSHEKDLFERGTGSKWTARKETKS